MAVEIEVGAFETNINPKFKLFRVGGWVAGLSGNIDHLNPIEVEVEVGLGLSLAISPPIQFKILKLEC